MDDSDSFPPWAIDSNRGPNLQEILTFVVSKKELNNAVMLQSKFVCIVLVDSKTIKFGQTFCNPRIIKHLFEYKCQYRLRLGPPIH